MSFCLRDDIRNVRFDFAVFAILSEVSEAGEGVRTYIRNWVVEAILNDSQEQAIEEEFEHYLTAIIYSLADCLKASEANAWMWVLHILEDYIEDIPDIGFAFEVL